MTRTRHTLALVSLVVLTVGSLSISAQRPQYYQQADSRLSGTYELESTRGDNPQRAADAATRSLAGPERDRVYGSLINRLEPPQVFAIDTNGRTVTIASSRGPRVTLDADGRSRAESGPYGRTVTTRAEVADDRLMISTSGNRGSDFSVTFKLVGNDDLRVTRRLDNEYLDRAITIQSYYRRTSYEPRWDLSTSDAVESAVPDGTRLVATLDTPVSTRSAREGDGFLMTVRSPRPYAGTRIDGVVSRVNGYGRSRNQADMIVDFQNIRLRDGRTAPFSAIVDTVRTPDGVTLRVDREGGVRDVTGNDTALERGAVGAAVGALIGAIAGGGKGAAVGAVIGGAGTILVEGRDQLDLPPGTEVTMTVRSPRYR